MNGTERICFIVSPLGEDQSAERIHADTVLNLIIEPALEHFNFNSVRGDQITQTGKIDDQIVDFIHNAPLCIIILSGNNPNVFYECGRRHASGKPYIHLLQKGEKAPFDVAGIRYCTYDLTDGFTIRNSVITLRSFIGEYETAGYGTSSSSVSLGTISERLDRIENSLKHIIHGSNTQPWNPSKTNLRGFDITERFKMMQEPLEYAIEAIINGDIETLKTLLPIIETRYANSPKDILLIYAYAVKAGVLTVIDPAIQLLENNYESLNFLDIRSGLVAINDGRLNVEQAQFAIERLTPVFERVVNDVKDLNSEIGKADKKDCLVEIGLLHRSAKKYEDAIKYFLGAINVAPSAPAYYQISSIYNDQGNIRKALEFAEVFMTKAELLEGMEGERKDRYYAYLIDLYVEANRESDARRVFDSLSDNSLTRFSLLNQYPFLR